MQNRARINELVRVTESNRAGVTLSANEHVFPGDGIQNKLLHMFA